MPYNLTNYTDRRSQYPNKRKLQNLVTNEETEYNVYRDEGMITNEGVAWNAATLNALDQKIANQFQSGVFTPQFFSTWSDDVDAQAHSVYALTEDDNLKYKHGMYQIVNDLAFVNITMSSIKLAPPQNSQLKYAYLGPLPDAVSYKLNDGTIGGVFARFYAEGMTDASPITRKEPISVELNALNDTRRKYFKLLYNRGSEAVITGNICSQRLDVVLSITYKFR